MHRVHSSAAFVAVVLGVAAGPSGRAMARAGDDAPAAPAAVAGLQTRIYDVSALVARVPRFQIEHGPYSLRPDEVNDEARPMFGAESDDPSAPNGDVHDVVDAVRAVDRAAFDSGPAGAVAIGDSHVGVRASSALHEAIAARLAELEHASLSTVTIDVVALRGTVTSAEEGGLATALARGALVPLSGARAVGFATGAVSARVGAEQAFVQDEDVEVASKAKVPDPIVGIARDGIAFDADVHRASAQGVTISIAAWWASSGAPSRKDIQPSGDPVETIDTEGHEARAMLDLVPGRWSVLGSTGDVVFAVRASVRPHDLPIAAPRTVWTSGGATEDSPAATTSYDVSDLTCPILQRRGRFVALVPSNYTPKEPPTLREPASVFPVDLLFPALAQSLDSERWGDASAKLVRGRIVSTGGGALARDVGALLDGIRAGLPRPTRVRATVVELPLASLPEYWTGLDDGAALLADGGTALLARGGARIVDRGGVRCRARQRVATSGGREHAYVADFDVEIAEEANIGNPIVQTVLDGLVFDVDCRPAAGGTAASLDLRVDRMTWRSSRLVRTQHGDIECPTVGVVRTHGSTLVPLGSLRLVGAALDGGTVTLTIVGASAE